MICSIEDLRFPIQKHKNHNVYVIFWDIKEKTFRCIFYLIGNIVLASGLSLNTKAGLGVIPIISTAYIFSDISGFSFGDTTFVLYCTFVAAQLCMIKDWKVLLQIPFSIVFTRFGNLFSTLFTIQPSTLSSQLITLSAAILLTGIGVALTVNMRIVPNPGDGIVNAIGPVIGKDMGFSKNLFDSFCVIIKLVIGLFTSRLFYGIGPGTVIAVLATGRVIHIFNQFTKYRLDTLAGL